MIHIRCQLLAITGNYGYALIDVAYVAIDKVSNCCARKFATSPMYNQAGKSYEEIGAQDFSITVTVSKDLV